MTAFYFVDSMTSMINRIETELKLELSEVEFESCQNKLLELGFLKVKDSALTDYFFDIEKFDDKGFNFTRIRVYDGVDYEKTKKTWKLNDKGERIREEEETTSNEGELAEKLKADKYFKADKTRTDYKGEMLSFPCTFSFDKIVFPDETRYFMEAELDGVSADKSEGIRVEIKNWLLTTFDLPDRPEGIGMMKLVLTKAGMA